MSNYSELLRDPRWQKRRLEIFELDHWQCRSCYSKKNTLNVHHLWYEKGRNPWEYDNAALITLCEFCHEKVKQIRWQQAFLDLNIPEAYLLDIAMLLKYLLGKHAILMKDVCDKFKVRPTVEGICIENTLIESSDDLYEYFSFLKQERGRYING